MSEAPAFETLMQNGIDAHAKGEYESALTYRLQAFELGEYPQPWDRGRAARDVATSFDRLGDTERATTYAVTAYKEHSELRDQQSERGLREFTVSAMYAAILSARQNQGERALRYIGDAWSTSEELKAKLGKPHQYDVNLVGRVAGIEGVFAKPTKRTREIGKLAVQYAKLSETDQVLEPNTRKTEAEVKEAQRKALIRGWSARSIVWLQSAPTRRFTKPIARTVLNKIVL
jgi:hypothetical protein